MPSARPRTAELRERLVVVLAVLRAAGRVGWHEPRKALPDLAKTLRRTGEGLPGIEPNAVLPVVETLLPLLPPWGAGRCVKRSLLLLDLWSRAGLEPSLHLGCRRAGSQAAAHGHTWVTTRRPEVATFQPPDVAELWRG